MKFRILPICFLFLVLLASLSFVPKALAAPAPEGDFGAYPTRFDPDNPRTKSWFIYELKPGATKEDSITVVNNSERELTIKIYPVDATTTSDGAFALLNEDQRQTGIGSWIKIAEDEVTIGPKDRVDVPFTISIPKYTTVGDHPGGIIIQEAQPKSSKTKGIGVNIVSRVGTRVYETVPGAKVLNLEIKDLVYTMKDDHLVFTYTLVNKGNVILTPIGDLVIKDGSGKQVDKINLGTLGSVFPGKPTQITSTSNIAIPWFGQYNATVTLSYSPLKSIQKSIDFFIYLKDWREVLPVIGLLLLILLFNLRKIFRHGKRIKVARSAQGQPIPVPAGAPARAAYAAAAPADVDQAFIGKHIRLIVGLVCISILVLSILFAFVLQTVVAPRSPAQAKSTSEIPSPTQATAEAKTSPTSAPVDKSSVKVAVYNGTATAGAAKAVADALTKAGFSIIKTDNSDTLLNKTLIEYPAGKAAEAAALGDALPAAYSDYKQQEASDSATFTITLGQQ